MYNDDGVLNEFIHQRLTSPVTQVYRTRGVTM